MRLPCGRPSPPPAIHSPQTRLFPRQFPPSGLRKEEPVWAARRTGPPSLTNAPHLKRRGSSETECRPRTLYQHGSDCPEAACPVG